ncbi:hypothetical protein ACFUCH_08095 [Streptomyces olivaceus]|uniref:hypothetical protein n=1 Tax=Streptomyces olivaceus TaxID=47716 RepID=UPI003631AEB8
MELDGHDAERSIDPFAPAEEAMAEECLDYELGDRHAYRSDLANLKSALSGLALYHTIFLSEYPLRKELVSVIERARQFRDQGGNADDQEENERRAQTLAAAGRVYQTLMELKHLRPDPHQRRDLRFLLAETIDQVREIEAEGPRDEDGSRIWRGEWDALIQRLEVEALDIGDTDLRERIKEARVMMECHEEPFKQAGQQESRTRYIAAEHAMKSIEAFRDGDPLPESPAEYVHTRDFVLDFIAEWEASRR